MGLKTSGETMHSLNNASRRCAHVSAIFSPPGFVLPKWGVGKEAMVFTTCYVMQRGAKAGHTVGLAAAAKYRRLTHRLSQEHKGLDERTLMASQQPFHPW